MNVKNLMVVLVAVAGCGGSGMTGGDGGMGDMAGGGVETCKTDNMAAALGAHYAVKGTLNVNIKVTSDCVGDGCILDKDAVSTILLLADVTQNGQMATVTARPCDIKIPPVAWKDPKQAPTVLDAPPALVQSVKPVTATATLSGTNTCAGFTSMPIAIVIGAKLANAASDPLPAYSKSMPPVKLCMGAVGTPCETAMDNGCICDQDGDMKPGATVGAMGIPALDDIDKVYLALRTVVTLDGMVFPESVGQATPGQRLRGAITGLKLEQSPVGCHQSPMGGPPAADCMDATIQSAAALNPLVTQSVNKQSTFVGMPVDATTTCADLIANAATIFKNQ